MFASLVFTLAGTMFTWKLSVIGSTTDQYYMLVGLTSLYASPLTAV